MKKTIVVLFLSALILIQKSSASSCCGSSISMPALITTGEKWKFQTSFSSTERIFEITSNGTAVKLSDKNQLDIFKTQIKTGYLFENQWQVFTQFSYYNTGLGDMDIGVGRELGITDSFRTFFWTQLTAPTGTSIYDLKNPNDTPTGSGFWSPGLGLSINQIFGTWDAGASAYVGKGLARKIRGQEIKPGFQTYLQTSVGKSFGNWRVGGNLEYQREDGKTLVAGSKAQDSYSWPVTLSASYLDKTDIWTVAYSDETLLGPTQNTYLNRGISLSYVKRFF